MIVGNCKHCQTILCVCPFCKDNYEYRKGLCSLCFDLLKQDHERNQPSEPPKKTTYNKAPVPLARYKEPE